MVNSVKTALLQLWHQIDWFQKIIELKFKCIIWISDVQSQDYFSIIFQPYTLRKSQSISNREYYFSNKYQMNLLNLEEIITKACKKSLFELKTSEFNLNKIWFSQKVFSKNFGILDISTSNKFKQNSMIFQWLLFLEHLMEMHWLYE